MTTVAMLIAGGVGAWLRYEVSGWVQARARSVQPVGTAVVNVTGAILLAVLVGCHRAGVVNEELVVVLGTGFAGAFTTFSTWMVETDRLMEDGGRVGLVHAAANVVFQLAVGLGAATLVLVLI